MLRRLLKRFLAWLTRPLSDADEPLDEYWQQKENDPRSY